jgi:hypothetical protein
MVVDVPLQRARENKSQQMTKEQISTKQKPLGETKTPHEPTTTRPDNKASSLHRWLLLLLMLMTLHNCLGRPPVLDALSGLVNINLHALQHSLSLKIFWSPQYVEERHIRTH